jgi:formylglycine-generating enzyme required for sulfatase activity
MAANEKRVQEVFLLAIEVANPTERSALLDRECSTDPELRRRVETLLRADHDPASILKEPVAGLSDAQPSDVTIGLEPRPDAPPTSLTQVDSAAQRDDDPLSFLTPPTRPGSLGRLGHYEIQQVIGKGGFGTVLKAFDEKLHRIVAIKVLSPELSANGPARNRFIREARTAAAVAHEHVVTIHAVDEEHRPPYLVMQLIDGVTLQEKIDKVGTLGLREVLRIGMQMAQGLDAAHKQGLVHRDIKPANILLENGVERVKITDFGLARAVDDASVTQSGTVAGTPMYMSPEQAEGLPPDQRSDLFSLGTVLYAMCTGHPPFRATGTMAVLKRVIEDKPRPIREINHDIPDWLCDIIAKLHAKKPEDRFQTAKEVAELLGQRLADVQAGRVIERRAEGREGPIEKAATMAQVNWMRGRRIAAAGLAVLGVLFCVCTLMLFNLPRVSPPGVQWLVGAVGMASLVAAVFLGFASLRWRIAGAACVGLVGIGMGIAGFFMMLPRTATVSLVADDPDLQVYLLNDTTNTDYLLDSKGDLNIPPGKYLVNIKPSTGHIIDKISFESARFVKSFTASGAIVFHLSHRDRAVLTVRYLVGETPDPPSLPSAPITADKAKTLQEAWAKHLGVDVEIENSIGMKTRLIPPGVFSGEKKPAPRVEKPYRIGIHKVTVGQFRQFVKESGHKTFAEASGQGAADPKGKDPKNVWDNPRFAPGEQHPVGCLDWNDAAKFCEWLSNKEGKKYRLPSELEWEWACRAGTVTPFHWGDNADRTGEFDWPVAHVDGTHPVGIKKPNPWGLYDLYGMNTEFCLDPIGGGMHVIRGIINSLSSSRGQGGAGHAYFHFGLRVVCENVGSAPSRPPDLEKGPFVILARNSRPARSFGTLVDAVTAAKSRDTIEIRGNGPYDCAPISTHEDLTIRAGSGLEPVLRAVDTGADKEKPLITANAPLVLEGLDLQMVNHAKEAALIQVRGTSLHALNCRFAMKSQGWAWLNCVGAWGSTTIRLRNCVCLDGVNFLNGNLEPQALYALENCLFKGNAYPLASNLYQMAGMQVKIHQCTFASPETFFFVQYPTADAARLEVGALRIDSSANVFLGGVLHGEAVPKDGSPRPVLDLEKQLCRTIHFQEKRNLYAFHPGTIEFVNYSLGSERSPSSKPRKNLADWEQFWNMKATGSIQDRVRFKNYDAFNKKGGLSADDFRLTDGSPGKGAGPDGKDLGADVDLVGPGPAYERWKKTPEYQQWRTETGQPQVSESGWVRLFNGDDLTGWKTHPEQPGNWRVKDGELIGTGKRSHLFTDRADFENFHLRVEAKINQGGNSGVLFRCQFGFGFDLKLIGGSGLQPTGYEADMHAGAQPQPTGSVWRLGMRDGKPAGWDWKAKAPNIAPDQWVTLEIIAQGNRFKTLVDGNLVVEAVDDISLFRRGHLALQVDREGTTVQFRKIEIKELPPEAPRPLPSLPAEVLPFLVGAWKMEAVIDVPKLDAGLEARATGTQTFELVADGKYLRGFDTETKGQFETLSVHHWDPVEQSFQRWFFASNNDYSGPAEGTWDAAKHLLTWKETRADGTRMTQEVQFVDGNLVKLHLILRDGEKVIHEMRQTMTRLALPPHVLRLPIDPNRSAEVKVLDRAIGDWRNHVTVKNADKPNEPMDVTALLVARPVLGGRLIDCKETNETTGEQTFWLTGFDARIKKYRFWHFSPLWGPAETDGIWDEGTKTMTWKRADKTLEGRWTFKSDDEREIPFKVRDEKGNLKVEVTGVSKRIRPKPFSLHGKDRPEQTFDTLKEAIAAAEPNDTIDIHGNGPFVSTFLKVTRPLRIRAASGYRPVITFQHEPLEKFWLGMLEVAAPLTLEGIEFRYARPGKGGVVQAVLAKEDLRMNNCRIVIQGDANALAVNYGTTELNRCEILVNSWSCFRWNFDGKTKLIINDSVLAGPEVVTLHSHAEREEFHEIDVRFKRCIVVGEQTTVGWLVDQRPPAPKGDFKPVRIHAAGCIFSLASVQQRVVGVGWNVAENPNDAASARALLTGAMSWSEEQNLYPKGFLVALADWKAGKLLPGGNLCDNLEEWSKFWGLTGTKSTQGTARFQGGDILAKMRSDVHALAAADFRLENGSPGEDLGPDVDLVGPGTALERWRKTLTEPPQ